jgi:hypothetical protein
MAAYRQRKWRMAWHLWRSEEYEETSVAIEASSRNESGKRVCRPACWHQRRHRKAAGGVEK